METIRKIFIPISMTCFLVLMVSWLYVLNIEVDIYSDGQAGMAAFFPSVVVLFSGVISFIISLVFAFFQFSSV